MLEFLKNYYVFMLILTLFTYLGPQESYKKYMQFFIGIFIVVLFLKPVLEFAVSDKKVNVQTFFESFNQQMEAIEQEKTELEEGESIFEYFFFEGEGE